ncbi:cytochrome c [Ramlibacter sp. G-1-2-2]|uniref:Cytochrome c n=1 Tax=Ramlibacter agri TaxID=2728837 RepID=A0A848H1U0_9BURK|nr:cytochrome c [Ramlibacter agri]NML43100.1 cytochrome c [Ramlibacter agri]
MKKTLGLLLLAACTCAGAVTKTIDLPSDGVFLKPSPLPGYAKAQAQCVACHSAEYMAYQPVNAPRGYWENMVKRMQQVFKAPVNDADMPDIIDYLVKTYGNEQGK